MEKKQNVQDSDFKSQGLETVKIWIMGQQEGSAGKCTCAKPEALSSVPIFIVVVRINSCVLSSDLHLCTRTSDPAYDNDPVYDCDPTTNGLTAPNGMPPHTYTQMACPAPNTHP